MRRIWDLPISPGAESYMCALKQSQTWQDIFETHLNNPLKELRHSHNAGSPNIPLLHKLKARTKTNSL